MTIYFWHLAAAALIAAGGISMLAPLVWRMRALQSARSMVMGLLVLGVAFVVHPDGAAPESLLRVIPVSSVHPCYPFDVSTVHPTNRTRVLTQNHGHCSRVASGSSSDEPLDSAWLRAFLEIDASWRDRETRS
jgi:hypothetical protein